MYTLPIPPLFTLSVAPSLQAAALRMTGPEFCALTEQVRDHFLAGNNTKLTQLLAGQRIEATEEVVGQVLLGRSLFFGDVDAVEFTIQILSDEARPARQRASAASILGSIGDLRAVETLIEALCDTDQDVRASAARSLGDIGDPRAVEPLIEVLRDKTGNTRRKVAETLRRIGYLRGSQPLVEALYNENSAARCTAIGSLGNIGDTRAVEPLIEALSDQSWHVRCGAAMALGKIGDPRAVEPLIEALNDESWLVVRNAALDPIKNYLKIACPELWRDEYELSDYDGRQTVFRALAAIGGPRATEALEQIRTAKAKKEN